eukprot:11914875-Alexandrium_andersonii.AAC.1
MAAGIRSGPQLRTAKDRRRTGTAHLRHVPKLAFQGSNASNFASACVCERACVYACAHTQADAKFE